MSKRYTVKEAAAILALHEMTVTKLVCDGYIPSFKEGSRRYIRSHELMRVAEIRREHGAGWMQTITPTPPTDKRPNGRRQHGSAQNPLVR